MSSEYERAVTALYQAASESFVVERQRLSAELKQGGDKEGAARVAKLARPPLSAWVVNQLWWHARADFDDLFDTAKQLRAGKHAASSAHRQAVVKLTARAQRLLTEAGHAPSEATSRRVAMTLSSLAAAGSFDPDLPGALAKDREPAGFGAFGMAESDAESELKPEKASKADAPSKSELARERAHEHRAAERARQESAAREKRLAEQRERRLTERRAADAQLQSAKAAFDTHEQEHHQAAEALAAARKVLTRAEQQLEHARAAVEDAKARVAAAKSADD